MTLIMKGESVSSAIKNTVKNSVASTGRNIELAVIQVGDNMASETYIRNKEKACGYCHIESNTYKFSDKASKEDLISCIKMLNEDDSVNGIMVQLPLPSHLNEKEILGFISPLKDVDGFHATNVGNMAIGNEALIPCTALGIMTMLNYYGVNIAGKECLVVGRSSIVGKPIAQLLLRHDATVTVAHSKTKNLKEVCKRADLVVCAIGKPKFFTRDYFKEGAIVIDVGINRVKGKLCGDVDFDDVFPIASAITPVPGGVGPLTVAMLMANCLQAYEMQMDAKKSSYMPSYV